MKEVLLISKKRKKTTKFGFDSMEAIKDPEFRMLYNELLAANWDRYKKMKETKT